MVDIYKNERIDDLQCKGLKIIQNTEAFCFGIDAVLLSNFAKVKTGDRVIDLGTGTGIIPILIWGKTEAKEIVGVEIQEDMAKMACRSIALNNIEDRVKIINDDLKNISNIYGKAYFDVVISNPPYKHNGSGIINPKDPKAIARHEIKCNLEDVIKASGDILKPNGKLFMIHKPERIVDIIYLMRSYKIEPKTIRFVHPNKDKKPNLLLIEGSKYGRAFLNFMPPLYVYDNNGNYTEEIDYIYGRNDI